MDETVILHVLEASIEDPTDTAEVNVIAAVASVGINANGIEWTADFLKEKAPTFVGMPVNIHLDAEGEPTGHSRQAIGTIVESNFDEGKQAVVVKASLWGHYYPRLVKRVKSLFADKKLKVSMEFLTNEKFLVAGSEEGSKRPTAGRFSGMGFVKNPADTGQMVYLAAALEEDKEELAETGIALGEDGEPMNKEKGILTQIRELISGVEEPDDEDDDTALTAEQYKDQQDALNEELAAAHEGSFEWTSRRVMEHLSASRSSDDYAYHYILATYANYAIYQQGEDYFRIDFKRSGDKLNFGEPTTVEPKYEAKASVEGANPQGDIMADNEAPNAELVAATSRIESLEAELTAEKAKTAAFETEKQADAEAKEREDRTKARIGELDTIAPIKDETLRTKLHASVADMSDEAFDAYKDVLAASAKPLGGLTSDETIVNPAAPGTTATDAELQASMNGWRKEQAARFGVADPTQEGN